MFGYIDHVILAPKLSQGAPRLSQGAPEVSEGAPTFFQAHIVTATSSISQLQASASLQVYVVFKS